MKTRAIPTTDIAGAVRAVQQNLEEIDELFQKGVRAPLGTPDNPSIAIGNLGVGLFSADGAKGLGITANSERHRAASSKTGSVLEIGPNGAPEGTDETGRLSVFETDPTVTDDVSRIDLVANSTDFKLRAYARNLATLQDFLIGVDDGSFTEGLRFSKTAVIGNEQGADLDFRFEGDTATSLLVLDAGLDAVQIGTTVAGAIADFRTTAIVLNESGADRDIRMEGDTDVNLLYLDAGLDAVGIGTVPASGFKLHVNGDQRLADELLFDDAVLGASAVGRLRRNGNDLTWHDSVAARNLMNAVRANSGGTTYSRRRLNVIPGASGIVSVTVGEDATDQEVDLTLDVDTAAFDERAQDAVGTILLDSATIDFTYTDATPSITAKLVGTASRVFVTDGSGDGTTDAGLAYDAANDKLSLTNSSTNVTPLLETLQASTGDSGARITLSGGASFMLGIDNSDSDKFKLSYGSAGNAALGTNDYVTIGTDGVVALAKDLEFDDQDGTPVADRRLRVIDGLILSADTSQVEGRYFKRASLQSVEQVRETGGPTDLTVGAVADGQFLQRSGATIVGAAGGAEAAANSKLRHLAFTGSM